jgi:hypothetical protein
MNITIDKHNLARKFEQLGEWENALKVWQSINPNMLDAKACELIIKSNQKGDEYRAMVDRELGEEPCRYNAPYEWLKWHSRLREIYNKIYRQS